MEIIILVLIAIIIFAIYKASNNRSSFFKELTDAYPKYTILKKVDMYLICDCDNHRKEPEELVFIRFNSKRKKTMYKRGNSIVVVYPKEPNINELKRDLRAHIEI